MWLSLFRVSWVLATCYLLLATMGLLVPQVVGAQIVPCVGLNCTFNHLLEIPVRIFNWLLGLAALILMLLLVWSGIQMLLFYWSDVPESSLQSAKLTFSHALFGFVIVVGAYLIVNILVYTILGLQSGTGVARLLQQFGL